MKKKNIYNILSGLFILGLIAFTSSCKDYDFDTDSSYDRLFHTSNLSVTAQATEAEVTWKSTPRTSYYVIELSKDSFDLDIVRYGEDKSITKSPYTLTELDNTTKYYIRIKSVSDAGIPESKWGYTEKYFFTTKSEQIMQDVSSGDRTAKAVTLNWIAGMQVSHILLTVNDEVVKRVDLTEADKENGTITIDGLQPLTNYVAAIYNGEVKRGSVSFQTYPEVPDAERILYLTAQDSINQETFDTLTVKNVTLAIPGGVVYANPNNLTLPDGLSITFFGLPAENKATLAIALLKLSGSHGMIKFNNLDITGIVYENGVASEKKNNYLINQSDATAVGSIEFEDCLLHDFGNTPFRLQTTSSKIVNTFSLNNCVVYNLLDTYYFINVNTANTMINQILITNSTFYNVSRVIMHSATNSEKLLISDCTFNDIIASGRYLVDYSTAFGVQDFVLRNNIFGATKNAGAKGVRANTTPIVDNCYSTSDWELGSNRISGLESYGSASTNLFTDPAKGNFKIKDQQFRGRDNAGDPKWRIEY